MTGRVKTSVPLLILIAVCSAGPGVGRQDENASRRKPPAKEAPKPTPAASATRRKTEKRTPPPPPTKREPPPPPARVETGELTVVAIPRDSVVLVNGQAFQAHDGVVVRRNLAAGEYRVVVRKDGFRDADYTIGLGAGEKKSPLRVELKALSGVLNIAPTVRGATIKVVETDSVTEIGSFDGRVNGLELAPGRYRVTVSKQGHRPAVRDVLIKPDESVHLEPTLELEAAAAGERAPRPQPPRFPRDPAMSLRAAPEGKDILVTLVGRSGETSIPLGTVEVTLALSGGQVTTSSVSGRLTGYPCQFDFVRLENVAEFSFVEPPGTGNGWGRAVVRVRPKNSKRVMRFQINWKLVQSAASGAVPGASRP